MNTIAVAGGTGGTRGAVSVSADRSGRERLRVTAVDRHADVEVRTAGEVHEESRRREPR